MQTEYFLNIPNTQLGYLEVIDFSKDNLSNLETTTFIQLCNKLSQCPNLKILNLGNYNLGFLSVNKFRMLKNALSQFSYLKVS